MSDLAIMKVRYLDALETCQVYCPIILWIAWADLGNLWCLHGHSQSSSSKLYFKISFAAVDHK